MTTFTIVKKQRIAPKWKIPWYWIRGLAWWKMTVYHDCEITSIKFTDGVMDVTLKGRQEANVERVNIDYKIGDDWGNNE